MADRYVLDSYALLALFQDEPGAARVQEVLGQASNESYITVVNLGEVLYIVEMRRGLRATLETLAAIDSLPIRLVDVDRPLALRAARFKATTGMGYADCFAAALAETLQVALLTGDPDFAAVESSIAVEWLPRAGH
ncbi:MAG: PilT protein domain protein [Dehalococcoidia bacterium]|nr:PilT protein domain protein [Dehalococcoidia bacterium]